MGSLCDGEGFIFSGLAVWFNWFGEFFFLFGGVLVATMGTFVSIFTVNSFAAGLGTETHFFTYSIILS
jgi:hypothetical protein